MSSGSACPLSKLWRLETRRLAAAGVAMGIDLVDHIVLGDSRYCSFKEMGRL